MNKITKRKFLVMMMAFLLIAPIEGFSQSNDEPQNFDEHNGLLADGFGNTRMSMFVVGNFEAEFNDDINDGDLDGYLLIGSVANGSVDGAYLPRNYDNDLGQPDLPLRRNGHPPSSSLSVPSDALSLFLLERPITTSLRSGLARGPICGKSPPSSEGVSSS